MTKDHTFKEILIDLNKKHGVGILFSSHILQDMESLSHNILYIEEGRAKYHGSLNLFLQDHTPKSKIIYTLNNQINEMRVEKGLVNEKLRELLSQGACVEELVTCQKSLEEIIYNER